MRNAMNLEQIIKEIRHNNVDKLLGDRFAMIDSAKILIYAEYSVSPDTEYIFLKSKLGQRKIVKIKDITYEKLCSLKDLTALINFYLSEYDRKPDDVLVIDIIDHLND